MVVQNLQTLVGSAFFAVGGILTRAQCLPGLAAAKRDRGSPLGVLVSRVGVVQAFTTLRLNALMLFTLLLGFLFLKTMKALNRDTCIR